MKNEQKLYRRLCLFVWLGTAMTLGVEAYLLHLARAYPEVERFAQNARIIGCLLLVWLATAVYFTVRTYLDGKKKR